MTREGWKLRGVTRGGVKSRENKQEREGKKLLIRRERECERHRGKTVENGLYLHFLHTHNTLQLLKNDNHVFQNNSGIIFCECSLML